MSRLRRDRPRRRLARRALRRGARRGRPARRGRRARARRRRVLVLGLHPVEDAAASGRGRARRPRRGGERRGRRRGGARLARLHGLELLRRRPGALAGGTTASTCSAGTAGWPAPGVVDVDGVRHTAEHVVVATGAEPFVPPVPGLRELDGVWTNREVTGMKAVPRRLLVLGGGPVGVEMAQAVRRLGGEVALVERRRARAPARAGAARRGARRGPARATGSSSLLGIARDCRAARRARTSSSSSTTVASCAATACSSPPAGARASRASAWRRSASSADPRGIPVDAHLRAGERLWAIGDVTGIWPLTHVGKYQGEVVAANILGDPREANYDAVPRVVYTDPQAAAVGATEAPFSAHRALTGDREDRDLHARVRRVERLPDAAQRRRAADRRVRARPGGGRVAAAGDARDPRAGSRSRSCATRSSRSRPSPRSTSGRCTISPHDRGGTGRAAGRLGVNPQPQLAGQTVVVTGAAPGRRAGDRQRARARPAGADDSRASDDRHCPHRVDVRRRRRAAAPASVIPPAASTTRATRATTAAAVVDANSPSQSAASRPVMLAIAIVAGRPRTRTVAYALAATIAITVRESVRSRPPLGSCFDRGHRAALRLHQLLLHLPGRVGVPH